MRKRERLCKQTLISLMLVITVSYPARAQVPPEKPNRAVPADGWQRGLEIGGMFMTFIADQCGTALLGRIDGNATIEKFYGSELGISYGAHRGIHIGLGAAALGLNLASAWQQLEINRQRDKLEFRHWAHNALLGISIANLVASAILGIVGTQTHARDLDVAMRVTGSVAFFVALGDVVLFGGHDNSILFTNVKF